MAALDKLGVLVVESDFGLRQAWCRAVEAAGPFRLAGETGDVERARELAAELHPRVVLFSMDLPGAVGVAEELAEAGHRLVAVADRADSATLRQAMRAGARDFLLKPVGDAELAETLRRVTADLVEQGHPVGRVVCVFSTKGGVGKTTISVNLAVALSQQTVERVALLDLDLELGNAATLFGLHPEPGITALVKPQAVIDQAAVRGVLQSTPHAEVDLLSCPPRADLAPRVEGSDKPEERNYVAETLTVLRQMYPWVVVDTGCNFREANLTALDLADQILLISSPEVPTLHNTARSLDILVDHLDYGRDKLLLVLNRANSALGITMEDIRKGLNYPISFHVPSDGPTAVTAANEGRPFMSRRGNSPLKGALANIAQGLLKAPAGSAAQRERGRGLARAPEGA